jgi:hypothetical protein
MFSRLFRRKKFKEPLDARVFTSTHVMKEKSAIVLISHELDGDWQFMSADPISDYTKVAMVVSLGEIIKLDRTVLEVADLPAGYIATRKTEYARWEINKIEYTLEEMQQFGFYCSLCGQYHKNIPMVYGADAPVQYYLIAEDQRDKRCELTKDQCIIDGSFFFIRGHIEIEVEDSPDMFCWSVWVSIKKEDFEMTSELWDDENRILAPHYQGKIATSLEPYPDTVNLPAAVITREVGVVPKIEILESNHPLYFEQNNGIDMKRVVEFAGRLWYNH